MRTMGWAFFIAILATACGSTSLEEQVCRNSAATADCPVDDSPEAMNECIQDLEQASRAIDAAGCGVEWDAVLRCASTTRYQWSGDNFPECQAELTVYLACCTREGGCPVG